MADTDDPIRSEALALPVALTALAGAVDAIGFLKLGGLYLGFMSANSTQTGVYTVLQEDGALRRVLILVGLFVLGAFIGGVLGSASSAPRRRPTLLWSEAGLILLALVVWRADRAGVGISFLVLAMGLQTAVLGVGSREAGLGPLGATAALARFGAALAALVTGDRREAGWAGELLLWLSLILGAGIGTALYARFNLYALAGPALLAGALALLESRRRPTGGAPA